MRKLGSLVLVGSIIVACQSHPSTGDALRDWFGAFCDVYAKCGADTFNKQFPQGKQQCVDQLVKASGDSDLDADTKCDQDGIDKCTHDIGAETCPEFDQSLIDAQTDSLKALPASCRGC